MATALANDRTVERRSLAANPQSVSDGCARRPERRDNAEHCWGCLRQDDGREVHTASVLCDTMHGILHNRFEAHCPPDDPL
jgi:hypothetical protein